MNASIRSKVAALTVALAASAGFASSSMATASAESDAVQVGTAGDTRYVLTDNEVIWGHAPSATFATDRMGPVTEIPADGGPVYVGTAGTIKYIVTSNEVIWGAISPGTAL